ncbi:MAG: hypothetical protein VKJ04_02430 [Vampirovibrionales bacterium]|nr:hypothetical protein [Vampirovibrionales bacterium]
MSDDVKTPESNQPPHTAPSATGQAVAEKPTPAPLKEEAKEPPFNIDAIMQSTRRFTRKAWNLILDMRSDIPAMQHAPMRFSLQAISETAAEQLQHQFVELGVKEISRNGKTVSLTSTFEVLQKVIKSTDIEVVDAIRI